MQGPAVSGSSIGVRSPHPRPSPKRRGEARASPSPLGRRGRDEGWRTSAVSIQTMSAPWYDLRIARGMAAQLTHWHQRLKDGEKAIGWKVGFGAPAAMETLKITAPLIGHLTDRARLESESKVS